MPRRAIPLPFVCFLLLTLPAACGDADGPGESGRDPDRSVVQKIEKPERPPKADGKNRRPRRILVDQILITFKGASKRYTNPRSRKEAETLAKSLLRRIESGVSFDLLKERYSDARSSKTGQTDPPLIYCNEGVQSRPRLDRYGTEIAWSTLHPGWRRVAFRLKPGEVALAEYHKDACPDGFHVLKRLQ